MAVAVSLALPGIALALAAKPLLRSEGALLFGLLSALAIPIIWLISTDSVPAGGGPGEGADGR